MNYSCKKVENCFSDSQTWEYKLPVSGEVFSALLPEFWSIRRNMRLRRPVFVAELEGLIIKGVLGEQTIRASFPDNNWEEKKSDFENWLKEKNIESIC